MTPTNSSAQIAQRVAEAIAKDMRLYAEESALPDKYQAACEYFKPTEYAAAIVKTALDQHAREMNARAVIFEVVDSSNEEQYWPLGVFLDEAAAMAVLDSTEPPYNDDDPEAVKIEVRSRKVGFYPHDYTTIASRTWVRQYASEDDSAEEWKAGEIKRTLKAQQGERLDGQPPHSLNNPAFIRDCAPSGAPDL